MIWTVSGWNCGIGLAGSQTFCTRGGREVDGSFRTDDGWTFQPSWCSSPRASPCAASASSRSAAVNSASSSLPRASRAPSSGHAELAACVGRRLPGCRFTIRPRSCGAVRNASRSARRTLARRAPARTAESSPRSIQLVNRLRVELEQVGNVANGQELVRGASLRHELRLTESSAACDPVADPRC